jgi:trehalose synthase
VNPTLSDYSEAAGAEVIDQLVKLGRGLRGRRVVHVNSTRSGGGVAEILARLVPLMEEVGIPTSWEVIEGNPEFFAVTKAFHNALQGQPANVSPQLAAVYEEVNRENAARLHDRLAEADFVFVHDPQPAALLHHVPERRGKWIWRCHIDASAPHRPVWKRLREFVAGYDASIFSLATFAQPLPHPQYLIPPSIDPLSAKNLPMTDAEVSAVASGFGIDPDRPMVVQVSRFDRFKDPVGVIRAYRMVKARVPLQLVLVGGTATDDPEGEEVLREVRDEAAGDPDIHVLLLPPDSHRAVNALQRRAEVVLQKSLREGFGLTVTEAMWKGKPVIGGETGGITLQVVNGHTGYRVLSPEGAAFRIRYLLNRPGARAVMGQKARRYVRENFLLTRHLREYLTLLHALQDGDRDRVEIH